MAGRGIATLTGARLTWHGASVARVDAGPSDAGAPTVGTVRYPRLEPRDADCAAKLKKRTLTNLYNERPAWLDLAHKKLDAAVAAAYGWPADLSDEQILEKLLALNLERAAEEAKAAKVKKTESATSEARRGIDLISWQILNIKLSFEVCAVTAALATDTTRFGSVGF